LDLGGIGEPLEITDQMRAIAKKIFSAFPRCAWTGADILRDKEGNIFIGELNASPGTMIMDITGHNFFEDVRNYIIKISEKWKEKLAKTT